MCNYSTSLHTINEGPVFRIHLKLIDVTIDCPFQFDSKKPNQYIDYLLSHTDAIREAGEQFNFTQQEDKADIRHLLPSNNEQILIISCILIPFTVELG